MNISEIINDLKMANGLNTVALPFNEPVENVISEILKGTVRTFSNYKHAKKEGEEYVSNLRSPDEQSRRRGIYFLPGNLTTTHVHEASAFAASTVVSQSGEVNNNAFTVGSPFVGFGSYYPQDILNAVETGAAINKYAAITSKPPTSKWLGYNKIQLFDFPENVWAHFVVECDHDLSGETITESCRQSFMQLANLDVQRTLYAQLKNMINIGGAFKATQLNIDSWSGAEAAYWSLLEKWDESFHLDDLDLVQFF